MTPGELLAGIRDGDAHAGGIRCLRLLMLEERHFVELQSEVATLCDRERPSDVRDCGHVTNWTRPRGEVMQYSLLNLSGRTEDFSSDHNLSSFGKRFHLRSAYPRLAGLIDSLPDLINFRVNLLGPGAQLAAHEEHSIVRTQRGSVGACIRSHLPIQTNAKAELMLDGHVFHLQAGIVHLVNHGCIHTARNKHTERRVHLVWDQLLTRAAYDALLDDDVPSWATRVPDDEQNPIPLRVERIGTHMRLPPSVGRYAADELGLCDPQ